MNRMTRAAAASALAAAVALGAAAPAAVAAPKATHAKVVHKAPAKAHHQAAKAHTRVKLTRAERRLAAAQRTLTVQARNKDRQLGRVATWPRVASLEESVRGAVLGNVATDRASLGEVRTTAKGASWAEVKTLRGDLRKVRPELYRRIAAQLHRAARLQTRLDALQSDPALAATVDPLGTKLQGTVDTLETYTASTPRRELVATQRDLTSVAKALESAQSETGTDTGAEPGTTTS
jgi:hypothetical protein